MMPMVSTIVGMTDLDQDKHLLWVDLLVSGGEEEEEEEVAAVVKIFGSSLGSWQTERKRSAGACHRRSHYCGPD
jgi:hypothetical protein